jgi:hypothetical protein
MLLRVPLLAAVGLCLLTGILAGLGRLGVMLPAITSGAVVNHGPLMIGGVLGTLISLERAVALSAYRGRQTAAYGVPLLAGVGGFLLALGSLDTAPKVLLTAASAGLVVIFYLLVRRHLASFTVVMALGSVCWLVGNLLWLAGQPVYQLVHLWAAFLILTVVGERLELSRILRLTPLSQRLFLLAVGVYLAGVLLTVVQLDLGVRLAGVGLGALAAWLLRYDIARRTVTRSGLPRFIAVCLLAGYAWLGAGGVFALVFGGVRAGVQYEALLHALLLGFIFSMIFGHALIIIPAIIGRTVGFRRALYLPLALLHGSLVVRVAGGLLGDFVLRRDGAVWNVIAVLGFIAMMGMSALLLRRTPAPENAAL